MIKRLIDWQNQFRSFWQAAVGLVIIYCPVMGQASPPPITGPGPEEQSDLGEIFGNMFYIVLEVRGLMQSVFLVTAAGLFMGALVRYKKYKQNPVESPISSYANFNKTRR